MQSFSELSLSPPLLRAITDMGFEKPSPIQMEALPILLGEPTDFIGLAATGTGKTAAFGLPLLEKIDPKKKGVQGLILCPTRELAIQVAGQISLMGKAMGVKALPVYGGSSFGDQVYGLKQGATIVVGTPGRLVDHLDRGTLNLSELVTIVLDEADEMISMGFKEDLEKILGASQRETCKIWLFSATMDSGVRSVANEYLKAPKQVQVNKTEMLSQTVEQFFYHTQERDKPEILCKLIDMADNFYGLIFCQTKSLVVDLTQYLIDRGHKVDCLHGDKDQSARERTMNLFRARKVSMLVCTDVASRGLDVKDITHVINYSLPRELDNYVHRIGRTARSGKSGIAMSLVTPSHRMLVQRIERLTKSRMVEGKIPSRREIMGKKISAAFENFAAQDKFARAVDLLDPQWKESLAAMTNEEIAGRFLVMQYPEIAIEVGEKRDKAPERMAPPRPSSAPREASRAPGRPYEERAPRRDYERRERPERPPRRDYERREPSRRPPERDSEYRARDEARAERRTERQDYDQRREVRDIEGPPPRRPTARERFPKHEGPNRRERRMAKFGEAVGPRKGSRAKPMIEMNTGGDRPPRRRPRTDTV